MGQFFNGLVSGIFLLNYTVNLILNKKKKIKYLCIMAEKKSKLVEIKTKPTTVSVQEFIHAIQDEQKQKDSLVIMEMMKKTSGEDPVLWGKSIIGFGNKRYKSPATGREVDWFRVGFSPRKANLSLYISLNLKVYATHLEKLGKHKTGVGCIYVNKLEDIDLKVLQGLIETSLKESK
ncbi:MAG: DUF1801 domain-containing protein [Saprospiraceae bacterium]|nr:DUF1801 domain-containing protein [Saprospiraceae bacterium]